MSIHAMQMEHMSARPQSQLWHPDLHPGMRTMRLDPHSPHVSKKLFDAMKGHGLANDMPVRLAVDNEGHLLI